MAMHEGDTHLVSQRMEASKQLGRDLYHALQIGPVGEGKASSEDVTVSYGDLNSDRKYDPFKRLLSHLDYPYRKLKLGVTFENRSREADNKSNPTAPNYRFTLLVFHTEQFQGHIEISFGDHGKITLPHSHREVLPNLSDYCAAIQPNLDGAADRKSVPPTEEELMLYENFKDLLLAKVADSTEA